MNKMKNYKAILVSHIKNKHKIDFVSKSFRNLNNKEILVRIKYSCINYKDALSITGKTKIIRELSLTPGLDFSGIVIESNSKKFAKGDKVLATGSGLGESIDGGFSEYVYVPDKILVKLPDNLSLLSSMQIGTAGFTSAIAIEKILLNKQSPSDGPIVVSGATGGVGSLSINIFNKIGYKTIAITRKRSAATYLKEIGASEVLNFDASFSNKVLNSKIFAGAIDNVGGSILDWIIKSTFDNGNIVSVGMAQSEKLETTVIPFIIRGINLLGVTSTNYPNEKRNYIWKKISKIYKPTKLNKINNTVIELKDVLKFSKKIISGKSIGRTIIKIN